MPLGAVYRCIYYFADANGKPVGASMRNHVYAAAGDEATIRAVLVGSHARPGQTIKFESIVADTTVMIES